MYLLIGSGKVFKGRGVVLVVKKRVREKSPDLLQKFYDRFRGLNTVQNFNPFKMYYLTVLRRHLENFACGESITHKYSHSLFQDVFTSILSIMLSKINYAINQLSISKGLRNL